MTRPIPYLAAVALATSFALAAATPLAAQQGRINVNTQTIRLPDGLTVVLHRDTTTPTIASNIWYYVGSAREIPGRTGFAHLFEHIMFEGSKNVPEGKIDEWFEAVGGSPNGSTTQDRTNYMQSFSSNALDLALFIESDRMGFLLDAMSPASVDGQRDVVKNERRQSYDNQPYGLADQVLTEAIYPPSHPYSWPVIGYMDHLSNATYDDVANFFRKYYTPNNATLVLAGDLDTAQARIAAQKWFSDVPRGENVPAVSPEPPVIDATQKLMLEDRVQLPRLYMRWVTPAAYKDGDAALTAVGRLLSGGKNSRLYKRLVYDLQIASDVGASQNGSKFNGEFQIVATAQPGHTLDELDRVIREELQKLASEPPTAEELQRIVNQYEVSFLDRLERVAGKADQLNEYLFYTGTPDYFNQDLARFRNLTPQDLSAAAARWLDADHRVMLSVVPQGKRELGITGSTVVPNTDLQLSPAARGKSAS
jgi:zinc protease